MSAGAPWSVKGIDPKAREVAKDHARRSGMTLGAWLNHVILEDEAAGGLGGAIDAGAPDLARIAQALDRITERIEASETRTGLAINGVEHSIRQAMARIESSEGEQHAAVLRLEDALAEVSTEARDVAERLRRLEGEGGPRSDEALRALEGRLALAEPDTVVERVLESLGERLAQAEARTAAALDDLRGSLSSLDARLQAVEQGAGVGSGPNFEALGQVLTDRVEAVRAEVAQRLRDTAGGAVEARLAEMAAHVAAAEARSSKAVEAIGHQVLAMAGAVSRKLAEVDERGAAAIDQVGTEVARIAGAVELRMARGEQAQAQAFERLTAELTRATGELSARFDASEARAAQALAGVGEQMAQVSGRLTGTPEAPQADEARAAEDVAGLLGPPPEPEAEDDLPALAVNAAPFGPELFSRAEPEPAPAEAATAAVAEEAEPKAETIVAPWRNLDPDPETSELAATFAPIHEADAELFEPTPAPQGGPQLSTREVIEQARAAARAQRGDDSPVEVSAKVEPKAAGGRLWQGFGFRPRRDNNTLQTALMIAGGAAFFSVSAAGLTLLQGHGHKEATEAPAQPAPPPAPRAAMALAHLGPAASPSVAPSFDQVHADVEAGKPGAVEVLKVLAANGHTEAQVYLAQLFDEGQAGLPRDPAQARRLTALAAEAGDVKAMHNLGVYIYQGEGGPADATAAAQWFQKAADAGLVEAQYNLGLLYQSGVGVARDAAQARAWFQKAAAQGDPDARKALAQLAPTRPTLAPAAPAHRPHPSAQTEAAASRPAPARAAITPASSPNVQQAQLILTRLGYYQGPADGLATEAYKVALFRYQKDQRDQITGPKPYIAER